MSFPIESVPIDQLQRTLDIGLSEAQEAWLTIQEGVLQAHPVIEQGCLDPSNPYITAQGRKVSLCQTDDVTSFRQLIAWLYFGKASLQRKLSEDDDKNQDRQLELAKLYVMASHLQLKALKDEIVDVFRPLTVQLINMDVVGVLQKEDLTSSKLMKFAMDTIANDLHNDLSLYKARTPWSVSLRSMVKKSHWLATNLLEANHDAALRDGKTLRLLTYHEPLEKPATEVEPEGTGKGRQFLKNKTVAGSKAGDQASDSSETLGDESDIDLSDLDDDDEFETVVTAKK